jgi:hypothetical protein
MSQETHEQYVENIDPASVDPRDFNISYDPTCVQKLGNFGSSNARFLFDHKSHEPLTRDNLKVISPKLLKIVEEIERQDEQDMQKYGKKFKHFVFSNVKSGTGGAKIIATALMDILGMKLGYSADRKGSDSKGENADLYQAVVENQSPDLKADSKGMNSEKEEETFEDIFEDAIEDAAEGKGDGRARAKSYLSSGGSAMLHQSSAMLHQSSAMLHQSSAMLHQSSAMLHQSSAMLGGSSAVWKKVRLHDEDELLTTKYNNFFLLSSVGVYQQPLSVAMRKEILRIFNSRKVDGEEGNSYGEKARIMVMDGGFKEGIDLFDIKYIHIFEPQATLADQKQVIGRGTRLCGQKGLVFHPRNGWNLYVNIYDSIIPEETRFSLMEARTVFDLYMSSLGLDIRLINLTVDMERVCVEGSVDYNLNKDIHSFKIDKSRGSPASQSASASDKSKSASDKSVSTSVDAIEHDRMSKYIDDNFSQYKWTGIKMENMCTSAATTSASAPSSKQTLVKYTPTQDFIRHYFTPANPCKGMLLYNSVGTGKTCSAIATATSSFEKAGYTILWVTRTTLKNDIWKNMFEQVCSISIREKIEAGIQIPDIQKERMRLLSKAWSIRPMSYKQFSNLVSAKNSMYAALVKRNGAADPLRKTLIIIDEAHKLYGDSGLSTLEQPDMGRFYEGVMKSYEVSGEDSCRLLLMTATPITKSPMEIVKLMNLCKDRSQRIEDDFETFAAAYLDRTGHFTGAGRARFLNDIAGYISYLNREKDARSFAQPIVKFVKVNMMEAPLFREYDARIMRQILQSTLEVHKKEMEALKKSDTLSNINSKTVAIMDKVCGKYEPPLHSSCKKVVSKTKKKILQYVKGRKVELKTKTKAIRDNLKKATQDRKEIVDRIKDNVNRYKPTPESIFEGGAKVSSKPTQKALPKQPTQKALPKQPTQKAYNRSDEDDYDNVQEIKALDNDYQKYIQSSFYNMKSKCLLQPKFKTFDSFHTVVDLRQQIKDAEALVVERQKAFNTMTKNFKKSIEVMKKEIQDKPLLQARIAEVKETIKEEKDGLMIFLETKKEEIKELGKEIKDEKRLLLKLFKQSVKNAEKERQQYEADAKAIAQQDALLSMEIADLTVFIEDDAAKDVVSEAIEEMKRDLEEMEEEYEEMVKAKEMKAREKAEAKEQKAREAAEAKREKERAAAEAKEQKERAAREAKANKERAAREAKEMKAREKAEAKEQKAYELAMIKAMKAQKKEDTKTRKRLEKEARRKTAKK